MTDSEPPGEGGADLYLIHDDSVDLQSLAGLAEGRPLIGLPWSQRNTPPPGARVHLYLDDDRIRELAPLAIEQQWEVGILPHPEARLASRSAGVKGSVENAFRYYLQSGAIEADVLTCNGQIVLSSVAIGEVLALRPYDASKPPTRRSILLGALGAVKNLRLRSYRLTTAKDQKINLAALGMVVVEQTQSTLIGRRFSDALSISDGRLTMLVFAPRSVFSYLWFLLRILLQKKISLSRLPDPVGLIVSERVLLETSRGVDYSLDGTPASAKAIEFRTLEQRLRLLPGPALTPAEDMDQPSDKDKIRMNHLPVDETARQLVEVPLPFFNRASEEEYRDLFVSLRENASLSSPYLVLMVLSMLLALTGLYANSAPVIIGAMILAPLMAPIISLAMGLARTEPSLIRNSLRTLLIGIGSGLFCAISVAWLMPLENLTTEMQARLSPTLLDLSVAVISGVAGAYAHAKEEIAKSLAGVAIAVALVPPLSVAGIGVGWADWSMAEGAFLLFFTNLVGIALAAVATFLVLGFAPFKLAKKGIAIALLLLAVIVGPLYIAFADLVEQGRIMREIPTGQFELAGQHVGLRIVKVKPGTPPLVRVVLSSSMRLDESHVDALKQLIRERTGRSVMLEAQLNLRR
jgi:uncharacterized hydrophobic protein (TIGR00271 family)